MQEVLLPHFRPLLFTDNLVVFVNNLDPFICCVCGGVDTKVRCEKERETTRWRTR